jgi:hypothetical protein
LLRDHFEPRRQFPIEVGSGISDAFAEMPLSQSESADPAAEASPEVSYVVAIGRVHED